VEKLARLAALMGLCALVWWFSYDHGRSVARTRVVRLEAENISLREKLILAEDDLRVVSARLAEKEAAEPAAPAPVAPTGDPAQGVELPPAAPAQAAEGETGKSRLTVKLSENKGLFGGLVIVTMVELDSLEQEALVRAHFPQSGRRLARLMVPGDIMELELPDGLHRLYLDQIKGSLAFFLVDALPSGE
jgi:hypothetical protein